ncbi:MAG: two-component system response regulator [Aquabacterium sp.]
MSQGRILIVDDEPMNLILLEGLLEDYFQVQAVETAQEALDACRAAPDEIDMIVSDVMMPGMSGYELCQALRSDAAMANIPVLLVSSLDDEAAISEGLQAGAADLLHKPYSPELMIKRVSNLSRLTRLERVLKQAGIAAPA